MTPSSADLKTEIETGPLSGELAGFWNTVFEAEQKPADPPPPPYDPNDATLSIQQRQELTVYYRSREYQEMQRWLRIKDRFGRLQPDAAFEIAKILNDSTKRIVPKTVISRGQFLEMSCNIILALISVTDPAKQAKWSALIGMVKSGDDAIDLGKPIIQGFLDQAVADGLLDANSREMMRSAGTEQTSRASELGWATVTINQITSAKAGE